MDYQYSPSTSVPISIPRKPYIVSLNPDGDYDLYIVDLNSGGGGSVDHELDMLPTVRLSGKFFRSGALCVLGSTLYAFEGLPPGLGYPPPRPGKSVYKFELLNLPVRFKVDKKMMSFVCYMKSDKHSPCATPTPDGRQIMISSSVLDPHRNNFELFDPSKRKCYKLPNIDIPRCRLRNLTFLDESVFFVETAAEMYTLKFNEGGSIWKRMYHFHGAFSMGGVFEVISGVNICLTLHGAYDIDDSSLDHQEYELENACLYKYPDLSSFPSNVRLVRLDLILLDVNDPSDFKFGILLSGVEAGSIDIPHLILDVYSCDLIKCRNTLSEIREKERMKTSMMDRNSTPYPLPHASKVTTLKFRLGPQPPRHFQIRIADSTPEVSTKVCF
ncbi:hypothetical protein PHJA_002457400 [Phtheirospermum japonicum]|uniref:Uncharacterized protein n=1 Tax=Phtheirospermum japonicum TaxID=374723 RepID=A0A830D7M0_9LAMI|nr:hypothetical protein PHJA_002457400 [Phtheirospermum japonicum]